MTARVLLLAPELPDPDALGGVSIHVAALASAPLGAVVHTAAPHGADLWVEQLAPRRLVSVLPLGEGTGGAAAALSAALAGTGSRVLHVHSLDLGPEAIAAALQRTGVRAALTLHDHALVCENYDLLELGERHCGVPTDLARCDACLSRTRGREPGAVTRYRASTLPLVDSIDAFVAPSASVLELVRRVHPGVADRTRRIAWGVPPPGAPPPAGARAPGALRVAVVGVHAPVKGAHRLPTLLAACRDLDVEFHLFGATLGRSQRDALRAGARVVRHGAYARGALAEELRRAQIDVVLLPSVGAESFSLVLSEVTAAGHPVVASDVGALGERVREQGLGFTFDPWAPDELRSLLSRLAREPERLAAVRAVLSAVSIRTESDMVQDHVALWEELAAASPHEPCAVEPLGTALCLYAQGVERARRRGPGRLERAIRALRSSPAYRDLPLRRLLPEGLRKDAERGLLRLLSRGRR